MPEPGNPQSLNRYAYVYNNPARYTDPSEHDVGIDPIKYPQSKPTWYTAKSFGLPSVYSILPGGAYGHGTLQINGRAVSLYVPPVVWYPQYNGRYTRYDPRNTKTSLRSHDSFIGDYWYGDEVELGSYSYVLADTWESVAQWENTHLPSPKEALAGATQGAASLPESGAPSGSEMPIEHMADLGSTAIAAFAGVLGAGRSNRFVLQENASGSFRMIVLTRQLAAEQTYYVSSEGLFVYPHVWHGPVIRARSR